MKRTIVYDDCAKCFLLLLGKGEKGGGIMMQEGRGRKEDGHTEMSSK